MLIDDVFNDFESHCITIVHNPRGIQGTNFSYTHEYAYFIYPKGKKIICDRKIDEKDISYSNLRNWGGESLREDAKNCFYPIIYDKKIKKIVGFGEVCKDDYHPKINEVENNLISIYPVDKEGIERKWRYARQSIEKVKHLLRV